MDGLAAIADERIRQFAEEGYTAEHDKAHGAEQLMDAALAYVVQAQNRLNGRSEDSPDPLVYWPWEPATFRPDDDALRSIVKAGALLAAAYDVAQGH